jgi:adenosylmethionine-8-amino-7-oxononanoate aminotransferase
LTANTSTASVATTNSGTDTTASDAALGLPELIFAAAYRNGLVFRSFGDHILGFAPALTFTEAEFAQMFARLKKTLDDVLAAPDVRAALAG